VRFGRLEFACGNVAIRVINRSNHFEIVYLVSLVHDVASSGTPCRLPAYRCKGQRARPAPPVKRPERSWSISRAAPEGSVYGLRTTILVGKFEVACHQLVKVLPLSPRIICPLCRCAHDRRRFTIAPRAQ